MKSIIEDSEISVTHGLIFVDQVKMIKDSPTKINQDIKFVDIQTWRVYEHYTINKNNITNALGFFNNTFDYIPLTKLSFEDRRSDFQGYHMMAMTENVSPYITLDLTLATYDKNSQTYDVTNSVEGMFYDMFLDLQEYLNFTATLRKRLDGKWGPTTVLANGSIVAAGITKSVTSGFAEMIVSG